MTFKHTHINVNLPKLPKKIINHKRHYVLPNGVPVPSITTVLSVLEEEGIKKWREEVGEKLADYIMIQAQTLGTELHTMCEEYLNNNNPLTFSTHKKLMPRAHFEQIRPYLDKINNIYALEVELYSESLGLAGRSDVIAEYEGVPSIIDFKTARKAKKEEYREKYLLQLTAYANMWSERTNIPVKQGVIFFSAEDGTSDIFKINTDDYLPRLKEVIALFQAQNKENVILQS